MPKSLKKNSEQVITGDLIYHIGKVRDVLTGKGKSADPAVQAVVKMWDGNLLILKVEKKIASKIKKDNFILADYSPLSDKSPYRRMTVIKILSSGQGESIWEEFTSELDRRKEQKQKVVRSPMPYIR